MKLAKTLKGLKSQQDKCFKRVEALACKYEKLLSRYWIVKGDPSKDWIVGYSSTLKDFSYKDYLAREIAYSVYNSGGVTRKLARNYWSDKTIRCRCSGIFIKVPIYGGGQWFKKCTSKAFPQLYWLERKIEAVYELIWTLEDAILAKKDALDV